MTHKTLITGGAGFIGSNLALALLQLGHEVTVLDNLSPQIHGEDPEQSPLYQSVKDRVRFLRGDVTDAAALSEALTGQTHVVHFAAETGTGQSMYRIAHYDRVNHGGTALLLDLLATRQFPVRRVLVASSRSIYGEGRYRSPELGIVYPPHRSAVDMSAGRFEVTMPGSSPLELMPTDESSALHPSSMYGITKQVQEQLVMTMCPALDIEGVALRYQNVYGPGQSLSNPYTGILAVFSNLVMQGKALNIFEDGLESRDFVFIDDVVNATALALESPVAANEVINIGAGRPTDVLTVARTIIAALGREVPVQVSGNYRIGDIRHNYACLRKAERLLGFHPAVSFEEGIRRFCTWAAKQGPAQSDYAKSIDEMRSRGLLK